MAYNITSNQFAGSLDCTSSDIIPMQLNPDTHQRTRLPFWVQRNKSAFSRFIEETFTHNLSESSLPQEDTVVEEDKGKVKWLHKHQVYVSELIQTGSPYRGILLYHGLGSGKTAASIFISEGMPDRRVVIMLPASIEGNYRQEIESFANIGEKVKLQHQWCLKKVTASSKKEAIKTILKEINYDQQELISELIFEIGGVKKSRRGKRSKDSKSPSQSTTSEGTSQSSPTSDTSPSSKEKKKRSRGRGKRAKKEVATSQGGGSKTYGIWLTHPENSGNYESLSKIEREQIDTTVNTLYKYKYKFLHYNAGQWMLKEAYSMLSETNKNKIIRQLQLHFPEQEIKSWKDVRVNKKTKDFIGNLVKEGIIANPFDHKIVIVDEIHNMISMMVGGGYTGKAIYPLLMSAENLKLVFLSGTPAINSPFELGMLYNLLQGNMKMFEFQISDNTVANRNIASEILNQVNSVDYFSIGDNGKILLTRNPYGFVNHYDAVSGKRIGVSKPDIAPGITSIERDIQSNKLNESTFRMHLETAFRNSQFGKSLVINSDPKPIIHSLFPPSQIPIRNVKTTMEEARKDFFSKYVDLSTQQVKNKNNFRSSIMGLTSFFHETTKKDEEGHSIFPEKIRPPVQKINLSDYQFLKYCEARAIEREIEFTGAGGNEKQIKNVIEDDKDASYFKVLSRNSLLFVFPPNLERLWPSDLREREKTRRKMMEELYGSKTEDLPDGEKAEVDESSLLDEDEHQKLQKKIDRLKPQTYTEMKTEILDGLTKDNLTVNESPFNLRELSAKYVELLKTIQHSPGLVLGYSQFRTVEGIEVFRRVLMAYGYAEYIPWDTSPPQVTLEEGNMVKIRINDQTWITAQIVEMDPSDHNYIGFNAEQVTLHLEKNLISNGVSEEVDRDAIIKDYIVAHSRDGSSLVWIEEVDKGLQQEESMEEVGQRNIFRARYAILDAGERQAIIKGYNRSRNRYGADVGVLFITQAGAEGLSFFNVRRVCIMEPFWNMVKINQVIGRARRNYSHSRLPVAQRNVQVHEFTGTFTSEQLSGTWGTGIDYKDVIGSTNDDSDGDGDKTASDDSLEEKQRREFRSKIAEYSSRVADNDSGLSSDQFLLEISKRKEKIISGFLDLMKETAVDCEYNKAENELGDDSLREMECFKTETMSLAEKGEFIYYPGIQGQRKAPTASQYETDFHGRKIVRFTLDNPSGIFHLAGLVVGKGDNQQRIPIYDLYYYYGLDPILDKPTYTLKPIGFLRVSGGGFIGVFDPAFNRVENRDQLVRYDLIETARRSLEASGRFVGIPKHQTVEYEWIRTIRQDPKVKELELPEETPEQSDVSPYGILKVPEDITPSQLVLALRRAKKDNPELGDTYNRAYKAIIALRKK